MSNTPSDKSREEQLKVCFKIGVIDKTPFDAVIELIKLREEQAVDEALRLITEHNFNNLSDRIITAKILSLRSQILDNLK